MRWAGFVLLVVGLVLLCNTLGLLPWACWAFLGLYWPVLLIVAGVQLLVWRRVSVKGLVVIALIMVVVGGIVLRTPLAKYVPGQDLLRGSKWFWMHPPMRQRPFFFQQTEDEVPDTPRTMAVVEPVLPGVESARYELKVKGGKLRIGGVRDFLVNGKVEYWAQRPQVTCRVVGREAVVTLEHQETVPGSRADLNLCEQMPVAIGIDAGACDAELDLSRLKVTDLAVDIGASRLSISFGNTGVSTRARIKAGASRVDLIAPESVGVRIKTASAVGNEDFSDQGLFPTDGYWVSPGWDRANTTVDIEIQAGISSVRLKRV
ncbi:MAG: LiaF transmembrane domain-containing protein [Bacillota bacterium]